VPGRLAHANPTGRGDWFGTVERERGRAPAAGVGEWVHAARVAELPFHHRDPFDRLIIAQGLVESIAIVSGDPEFKMYGARIVW